MRALPASFASVLRAGRNPGARGEDARVRRGLALGVDDRHLDRAEPLELEAQRIARGHDAGSNRVLVGRCRGANDVRRRTEAVEPRRAARVGDRDVRERVGAVHLDARAADRLVLLVDDDHVERLRGMKHQPRLALARFEHRMHRRARLLLSVGEHPDLAARQILERREPLAARVPFPGKVSRFVTQGEDPNARAGDGVVGLVDDRREQRGVALADVGRKRRGGDGHRGERARLHVAEAEHEEQADRRGERDHEVVLGDRARPADDESDQGTHAADELVAHLRT